MIFPENNQCQIFTGTAAQQQLPENQIVAGNSTVVLRFLPHYFLKFWTIKLHLNQYMRG